MRVIAAMATVFCAMLSTSVAAQEVTCESMNNARKECEMNTRGVVRMVRQLSKSPCREGTDWGLSRHSVWVENGCRAVFVNEGTQERGPAMAGGGSANEVTRESTGRGRQECEMNTRGVVRLVRQLSKSPCREGTDWGLSKHSVWVENGCRAVFANEGTGGGERPMASHRRGRRGLPTFNATCPGNIEVHGDEGAHIFINGNQASVKKINDDYYEATSKRGRTTISISKNPDETLSVMYTRGNANGVCRVE